MLHSARLFTLTLFVVFCAHWSQAQTSTVAKPATVEGWADRLARFGTAVPQEKVYVHMDNTCYFLGDTIWFAAYTRRTDKDLPSNVSRVLYVELFNQDGYLVERQLIEMKQGRGHGAFALADTLYGGYYELRAYTRWQLNWGQRMHPHTKNAEQWFFSKALAREYYRDYDKLYSRVFPVYDKPKQPGEYYHDMTLRPLRRTLKEDASRNDIRVAFYPEGGHVVGGAPCRVAFEAATGEGEAREGKLILREAGAGIVAEATTSHRGRGVVIFTPESGKSYEATFVTPDGQQTAQARLNKVSADGVAMTIDHVGDQWKLCIRPRGMAAQRPLGLTVMHEGVTRHFEAVDAQHADEATIMLSEAELPAGVCQATVFDADGRVWADRLFFVRHNETVASNLTITGIKAQYAPYEQATLDISSTPAASTDGGHISLSVRDAALQDYLYDSGNILTEMLLASEIKGFVPQPEWYFEADDEEHRTGLDLLMMTQGWRRFDWQTMATPGAFVLSHPAEFTQVLKGVVHNYQAQRKEDELQKAVDAEHAKFHEPDADSQSEEEESDDDTTEPQLHDEAFQAVLAAGKQDIMREGSSRMDGVKAASRFNEDQGHLKREVRVHAEFTQPGSESIIGDVDTKAGKFVMQVPNFEEHCVLFLAASDTTKWKQGKEPIWVSMDETEYPEYYVRLSFPYPHFVQPYTFYHTHHPAAPEGSVQEADFVSDESTLMQAVTVKARRRGLRAFDASKPAFVMDAYQAFNDISDAGLAIGWYNGHSDFVQSVARYYIGDMNMERSYPLEVRFESHNSTFFHSKGAIDKYNQLYHLDKVYIYTDYSPRLEGHRSFDQSNQPTVTVDLRRLPDEGQRVTYRDRRYILPGFAVCDDFYHPDYSRQQPTKEQGDYRRTLYWNPDLKLDAQGHATVTLYTPGKPTIISVNAEGQTSDGRLLHGTSEPGRR